MDECGKFQRSVHGALRTRARAHVTATNAEAGGSAYSFDALERVTLRKSVARFALDARELEADE